MKVLLTIHHRLEANTGAAGAVLATASALRELGHEAEVLSHDNLPRRLSGRASLVVFPLLVGWRAFRERTTWDVLDFASSDGCLAVLLPRRLRPRVIAFHSHGLEHLADERFREDCRRGAQPMSWKYRWFRGSIHLWNVARSARRADVSIFLNHFERGFACTHLRVREQRSWLIPNALPDELISAELQPVPAAEKGLNVAFIGGYIPVKGIEYLVPAMRSHLYDHPNVSFRLLGTRVEASTILDDFDEATSDRCSVVKDYERSDLCELLLDYHVLVLPSLSEGFGIAALEAMACGLVPVVTRGHGFEEFVVDGENGLLVDRARSQDIVDALERLANDRALWLRLRKAAVRTASRFTWKRSAQLRVDAYAKTEALS